MKILVAGSSGLAGSAIAQHFLSLGFETILVNSSNLNLLQRKSAFDFILKEKPDVIIDAAAVVGGILENDSFPVKFISQNLQIQTNLMDAAHFADVDRFVFLASSCIYPRNCNQPMKEDYLLTGPLEKTNSAYAIAKIAGMELLNAYQKEFKRNWVSVLPTNLFGPKDNFNLESAHVLPALIRRFHEAKISSANFVKLWGTGLPRREFMHSYDLARAIEVILFQYKEPEPINVGVGSDISIFDLALLVSNVVGYEGEIRWDTGKPDGTPQKLLDVSKLTSLGWAPSMNLIQGVAHTYKWYKDTLANRGVRL